ncbi:Mitochondrial SSU ribosomal protein [Trypanosoma cruzi cruzi]|nr:Mitochondrial SSU ribosomal protein [Trypanosoma cruzi cruzi]
MLRARRPLPLLPGSRAWLLRFYSSTRELRQLQSRERLILGTHGAGVVQHASVSQPPSVNFQSSVTVAAPAADLFRTKVHEGTGTSGKDPYLRTLPNQESREPESSVSQAHITVAPTVDECSTLDRRWESMQYWFNDQHPRLVIYLRQLQVQDVPPISPAAESLLSKFEEVAIPKLALDDTDRQRLTKLWGNLTEEVKTLRLRYVFDRLTFESKLSQLCKEALEQMHAMSLSGKEGSLAVEALRRLTILKRNDYIQKHLIDVTSNGAYLGFGDAVWRVFFSAVEAHKAVFFGEGTPDTIRFAWESILQEDVVRVPDVTAPVALFLTLVCIHEGNRLASVEWRESSSSLDEGICSSDNKQQSPLLALLNPVVKRRFVTKMVESLLRSHSSNEFSKLLRKNGLHDLSRDVALCEAMNSSQGILEDDVAELVSRFESTGEVKTLLSSLIGGKDAAVRETVAKILGIPLATTVDWDAMMQSVDWTNNWRRLATKLLCDQTLLVSIHKLVKNAIGAKGISRHLFSEEYADQLQSIIAIREERELNRKLKIDRIVRELSSYQRVDQSCEMLRQLGVDMKELDQAALSIRQEGLVKRPSVDENVISRALEAVGNRHPNWVRAGVIAPGAIKDSIGALKAMLFIFIRLSYVPQTGLAAMAQRFRRRIGPIGVESFQFNIPTEVGFVEHYNNLEYKRYDWQGWYQRMVDVHNRNISLRCRVSDLKRLDSNGVPFVDMQTERRLLILAEGRVGMGVLMLDSDKYEDQKDNMTFGSIKLSELLSDARKAQLGEEYWPSVEMKVRKPSGQSRAHYSLIDYDRIEKKSRELYEKYRDAKKKSLFVTPMDLWLEVRGMQVRKASEGADADGYTVDILQDALSSEDNEKN